MNTAQLAQLTAMTQSERLGYYLKKLVNKDISKEQYDKAIKFVATLPNPSPIEAPGEVRTYDGQPETHNEGEARCDDYRTQARETFTQEPFSAPVERDDKSVFPRCADDVIEPGTTTHKDKKDGKSQKAKLLDLLLDYQWHTTREICKVVYGSEHFGGSRYAARIRDLKDDGWDITDAEHVEGTIYQYRLIKKDPVTNTFYGG